MKTAEKIVLPDNATIPEQWIKEDRDGYLTIPYPSKTIDATYDIHIEKATGVMGCTCMGFHYRGICSHVKKLRWVLKKAPKSTHLISVEAFLSLSNECKRESYRKIIDALKDEPMTCDELEGKLGFTNTTFDIGYTLSQRVSELYQMGIIESTGELRKTRRGRNAAVWSLCYDGELAI